MRTVTVHSARSRVPVLLTSLMAALLVGTSGMVVSAAEPTDGSLQLRAPARVDVGQPITVEMVVEGARDVAGYQAVVSFDPASARFGGLTQRQSDLRSPGQGVQALGPTDLRSGIAFGQYSCPSTDCVTQSTTAMQGASGTIRLARVTIIPERPGLLDLRVDGLRFVGPAGNILSVAAPTSLLQVQVGSAGTRHAASISHLATGRPIGRAVPRADLTRDGSVTHADAIEVALAWEIGQKKGDTCGALTSAADVNGDGCVDVADSQTLVARYDAAATQPSAPGPTAHGPLTFTVTTTGDSADANAGDGVCLGTGGGCTLRAAITEANLHAGPDTVAFAIPGTGARTINLGSSLPTLSDATGGTTIDGYTQPGSAPNTLLLASNAVIRIEIRSASATVGWQALAISSPDNVVRGLSMYSNWRSITFAGPNAARNAVVGNFIGTNAAGTFRTAEWNFANGGIYLNGGAHDNELGRPPLADRNVISGNPASGIYHVGDETRFNVTRNNVIGLTPSGTGRLANRLEGVDFNTGATDNVVGGLEPRERNVISGNTANGVEMSHGNSVRRTRVIGNLIGTDVTGAFSASYTVNSNWGIGIEDGVTDTYVSHNVVGNGNRGGIHINGYTQGTTRGTIVRDNLVGISLTGAAIPNNVFGIGISLDANTAQIGPGNVIANNPVGVSVGDIRNQAISIIGNSIYNNTELGIDLRPDARVTANDFGDTDTGANGYLNFPALTSATPSAVKGAACAGCTAEVFIADSGANAYGEGRTFLGSAVVGTDGRFNIPVTGLGVGQHVTSTATDQAGNTSEFSLNIPVTAAALPAGTIIATDTYTRTQTDRWQAADGGGFWALNGAAADFDVAGDVGTIRVGSSGQTRAASLLSVSARDVDIRARVRTDKVAQGGNQHTWLVARQVAMGTEYRLRLRRGSDGLVYLNAARTVGGSESYLSGDVIVPGLTQAAGAFINVRAEVAGVAPVSIRVKAWADGTAEPAAWTYTATDSSALLERPGAAGVRVYVQPSATNAPVTFGFDDFSVTAVDAPALAPVADFTWEQATDTLDVTFTDVSANDVDSWAWDFGDGNTSTQQDASHVYASSGSYEVTLTVTGPGGIDSESKAVVVDDPAAPPQTTYAADAFERVASGGWGTADTGGAYTGQGAASDFAVNGGQGRLTLSARGVTRGQYLAGVSERDVDVRFRVASDKVAQGGQQFIYGLARRVSAGNEYSAKLRFANDGRAYVNVSRFIGGAETILGSAAQVPGISHAPGAAVWVRMEVTGADPTTIRVKAWADGTAEPSGWLITVTDSFASLQVEGGLGLRGYLGGSATNAPVVLSFDDYGVTSSQP